MMFFPNISSWNVGGLLAEGCISDCHKLIKDFDLQLMAILKIRLTSSHLNNPLLLITLSLFPNESWSHNFDCSTGDRIWIKWNPNSLSFKPIIILPQIIHGEITTAGGRTILVSFIFVFNGARERLALWDTTMSIDANVMGPGLLLVISFAFSLAIKNLVAILFLTIIIEFQELCS